MSGVVLVVHIMPEIEDKNQKDECISMSKPFPTALCTRKQ